MKKRLILCFGLVIAVLLLVCTAAGAARADATRPSITAEQWRTKGYTVVPLSCTIKLEHNWGTNLVIEPEYNYKENKNETVSTLQVEGYMALAKDVTCLRETSKNGIVFNQGANSFTLTDYETIVTTGAPSEKKKYCIVSGGKYYFGEKTHSENNNITLKDIIIYNSSDKDIEKSLIGGYLPVATYYT